MKIVSAIIRWILVALLVFLAVIFCPSISSILFLAGAIIVLPIKPFDEALKKIKLIPAIRIIIAVILFIVGVLIAPGDTSVPTDNPGGGASSSSGSRDRNEDPGATVGGEAYSDAIDPCYHGQVAPHPIYEVTDFGNFEDIDKDVFETATFSADDFVGRWYEDGWLEGYYLELYGNGTWRYFGKDVRSGRYQIAYNLVTLEDSKYGIDVCMPMIFYQDDDNAYEMSLTPIGPEVFETRTDYDDYVCFWREDGSRHCDDLEAYYENKYPYKEMAGNWYPVGAASGRIYYKINAAAHWVYVESNSALEVGVLEENGNGSFTSEGGTWGKLKTFELKDDGYLYIDGEPYEKVDNGDAPPSRSIGTFCYDNGDGYIFSDDWTFESVPGSSFNEHGTFMIIGTNVLLYDDDGYQLHVFYQDEFMDWDGEFEDEARRKHMDLILDGGQFGDSIYYQIPD